MNGRRLRPLSVVQNSPLRLHGSQKLPARRRAAYAIRLFQKKRRLCSAASENTAGQFPLEQPWQPAIRLLQTKKERRNKILCLSFCLGQVCLKARRRFRNIRCCTQKNNQKGIKVRLLTRQTISPVSGAVFILYNPAIALYITLSPC